MKLTGRTRHVMRKRFMRQSVMVLQVEVAGDKLSYNPNTIETIPVRYWRDATPGDFDLTLKVQSDPE